MGQAGRTRGGAGDDHVQSAAREQRTCARHVNMRQQPSSLFADAEYYPRVHPRLMSVYGFDYPV